MSLEAGRPSLRRTSRSALPRPAPWSSSCDAVSESPFLAVLERDLKVGFRRFGELAQPLLFFIIVTLLFPFALEPKEELLNGVASGVLWVSALLAVLLGADALFRSDAEDGSLEQLLLGPVPLVVTVLAKLLAHWLVALLPLVVLVPLLAVTFYVPTQVLDTFVLAVLLATPSLTVLVALGAALTVSLKRGGALVGLLFLPLTVPLLIAGASVSYGALTGEPVTGWLYWLAALALLSLSLGPLAIAAALRVSME
jgi:heme exporter protein B